MKMKLDLSKFKLAHKDDKTATLHSPEGHEFKVAIHALHPSNRKLLEALEMNSGAASQSMPMAKGGKVEYEPIKEEKNKKELDIEELPQPEPKNPVEYEKMADGGKVPGGSGSPYIDPRKAKEMQQGATESGWQPEQWKKNLKAGLSLAEGGDVEEQTAQDNKPITINVGAPVAPTNAPMNPQLQQPLPTIATSDEMKESAEDATPEGKEGETPEEADKNAALSGPDAAQQAAIESKQPQVAFPTSTEAFQHQKEALQQAAGAEQHLANVQAAQLAAQAKAMQDLNEDYKQHYAQLSAERQDFMDDIKNSHIDPNRYMGSMDTNHKLMTGLGLILGGIGQAFTGRNAAMDVIQKNIDRDIDAQKAEIGKKETLLSANMRAFGDLHAATQMTKVMQTDILRSQLDAAAAKASNPIIKAKYAQLSAQLEAQVAPQMQQLALKQMLLGKGAAGQSGSSGDKIQASPAHFVPLLVPKEHQKAVFDEIKRAEDTRQLKEPILKAFDDTVKDYTAAGGLGRVLGSVRESRARERLAGMVGQTVTDLTGTARQAEFDNINHNMLPRPGDTDKELAQRRNAIVQYLGAKSSAPTALGYGINLDKFASTAHKAESNLTSQQKSFLDWARANPDNPKSAIVLRKLGLAE